MTPLELMNRRRRQLHVHSVIYYHMGTNIISDATFDKWSNELVALNKKHPELLHTGFKHDLFADWTGDTGMHLPMHDDTHALAVWLLAYKQNNGGALAHPTNTTGWAGDVGYKI